MISSGNESAQRFVNESGNSLRACARATLGLDHRSAKKPASSVIIPLCAVTILIGLAANARLIRARSSFASWRLCERWFTQRRKAIKPEQQAYANHTSYGRAR